MRTQIDHTNIETIGGALKYAYRSESVGFNVVYKVPNEADVIIYGAYCSNGKMGVVAHNPRRTIEFASNAALYLTDESAPA
jgi:hypothetical protein